MKSVQFNPNIAKKNEIITAKIVTGTGASKIGIFNENGKAIGKISQSYVDNANGERTWTIAIKIGSCGVRSLTVKAADKAGNWGTKMTASITIK